MNISGYGYLSVRVRAVMGSSWKRMSLTLFLGRLWFAAKSSITSHTTRQPAAVAVRTWGLLQWNTDSLSDLPAMLTVCEVSVASDPLLTVLWNYSEQLKQTKYLSKYSLHKSQKHLWQYNTIFYKFFYDCITLGSGQSIADFPGP